MMVKKNYFSFLFFFISSLVLYPQYTAKDSVLQKIKSSPNDTLKVNLYNEILGLTYFNDPKVALNYAEELVNYSQSINYPRGMVDGYGWSGYLQHEMGRVEECLMSYQKGMEIAEKKGWAEDVMGLSNNIASTYADLGKIDLALSYYKRALHLMDSLENTKFRLTLMNNIAQIYYGQGKIREALEVFYNSMFLAEQNGDTNKVAESAEWIGVVYFEQKAYDEALLYFVKSYLLEKELGSKSDEAHQLNLIADVCVAKRNNQRALQYYFEGLKIAKSIDDAGEVGLILLDMGNVFFNRNLNDSALVYYQQGLEYILPTKDVEATAKAQFYLGRFYFTTGNQPMAMNHLLESYRLAKEIGYPKHIRNATELLYQLYADRGDKSTAFDMYTEYHLMNDSVQSEENRRSVIAKKMQFEFDRDKFIQAEAEREMARIQKAKIVRRNTLQNSLILIGILIIFGIIFTLGFVKVPEKLAQVFVFMALLFLFEFLLVLTDPYLDDVTNGIPIYKLLVNSVLALSIFPIHAYMEKRLKRKFKK